MREHRWCGGEDSGRRNGSHSAEITVSPGGCDRYERHKKRQEAEPRRAKDCRVVTAPIKNRQTFIENVGFPVGSRAQQVRSDRDGQSSQRWMLLLVTVRAAAEQLAPGG